MYFFAFLLQIYYSALDNGPEHIYTAGGYYYLGNVLLMQERIDAALAFYDKVVDVWYKFLSNIRMSEEDIIISEYLCTFVWVSLTIFSLKLIFEISTICAVFEFCEQAVDVWCKFLMITLILNCVCVCVCTVPVLRKNYTSEQ